MNQSLVIKYRNRAWKRAFSPVEFLYLIKRRQMVPWSIVLGRVIGIIQ